MDKNCFFRGRQSLHPTGQKGLAVRSIQLLEVRAAREARAYLEACANDRYVHLLDGGSSP